MYRERYRLARFGRGGFVRLARQAQVPLLPVAVVGAEEIHPVIGKITRFAEAAGHPVHPDNPYVSVAWTAGLAAGADQMDDPDRSADRAAGAR